MEIAREDPARIAALVLVDTKASADSDEARAQRLRLAEQVVSSGSTDAVARAMLPNLLGATTAQTRPDLVALVRGWIESADPAAVAWMQHAMAARPESFDDLARLTVPSLVVWGEEDGLTPWSEQDLLLTSLRDARLARIVGAGHLSPVEDPGQVVAALLGFLRDVQRLPGAD
jgi:pimeloyl-ACP methyl ester carboxylesterase